VRHKRSFRYPRMEFQEAMRPKKTKKKKGSLLKGETQETRIIILEGKGTFTEVRWSRKKKKANREKEVRLRRE